MACSTHHRRQGDFILRWRRRPWHVRKIEEVEQVGLRGIAFRQRQETETRFEEADDRGVVHGGVPYIVSPDERGNYHVWYTEADLRRKPQLRGRIVGMRPRIIVAQVAMVAENPWRLRQAGQEFIRIDRDAAYVSFNRGQRGVGVLVCGSRHRWNVIVGSARFIKAEKKH